MSEEEQISQRDDLWTPDDLAAYLKIGSAASTEHLHHERYDDKYEEYLYCHKRGGEPLVLHSSHTAGEGEGTLCS